MNEMNERLVRQPEEWLRAAESALGIGFWTWNAADARLTCSAGFCELVGVNPAGVQLDLTFLESLVHPKDKLAIDDQHELATSSCQTDRHYRLIRPDGQLRCLHSQTRSFFDRDGAVTRVIAVVADVSEEQALRRRHGHYRALLQNISKLMGAALWISDKDGRLVDSFDAEGALKITAQVGGSSNWREILHPEDVTRMRTAWAEAVASDQLYRFNGRVQMADGEFRTFHAAGLPFAPEYSSDGYWGGFSATDRISMTPRTIFGETATFLLTPGQVRACRALLNWTAETLAARAGLSVSTVRRIEGNDFSQGQGDSMRLVMIAFQEAGLRIWQGDDGRFCVSDMS
jgi:PAS domain S-box-containing protein